MNREFDRPELNSDELDGPTLEVRAYRHGRLVASELCETEEAAADLLREWEEQPGVVCEVDDLSIRHAEGEILEPAPSELVEEPYPRN